jgi:hypothetical protein
VADQKKMRRMCARQRRRHTQGEKPLTRPVCWMARACSRKPSVGPTATAAPATPARSRTPTAMFFIMAAEEDYDDVTELAVPVSAPPRTPALHLTPRRHHTAYPTMQQQQQQ